MSEKSYWRKRPAAKAVYERRMAAEEAINLRMLSSGIGFAALLLAIFGVCMGNVELVAAATVGAVLAKLID